MADQDFDIIDEIMEDMVTGAAEQNLEQNIIDKQKEESAQPASEPEEDQAQEAEEASGEAEEENAEEKPEEAQEDKAEEGKPEEEKKSAKKGFFSKKPDKKDETIADLTDKLQRSLAEFTNFRNRTEKEKAAMYEIGARGVIEKILPVVDNFERGLAAVPEAEKDHSFAQGMDMIYKQLIKVLNDMGVQEIEAMGAEFNPDLHNAVMHIEDETLGTNVVAEVFQKGYTYHDNVIRYAMVKVAN